MVKCKFCNKNALFFKKIKSPYFNKEFDLYCCPFCKSRFFYLMEDKNLEELYEGIAKGEKGYFLKFDKKNLWLKQIQHIVSILGKKPEAILDIGCKTGDFLMHFDNQTIKHGVELSKKHAKIAKKRGLFVYNNFLEKVKFKRKYGVVTAYALLEHLSKPKIFFEKINSLVEDNGLLVIMIPTHQCLKERILTFFNHRWVMYSPPEHLNFYSRKFLDNSLKKEGFELVYRYYSSGGNFNHGKIIKNLAQFIDNSFLNKFPIFDHMYSFYKKIN